MDSGKRGSMRLSLTGQNLRAEFIFMKSGLTEKRERRDSGT